MSDDIASDEVLDWLLGGDPAIRWQVQRDLLDEPEAVWRSERARVETEGWGARLLAEQDLDGQWAGGAFAPASLTEQEWRDEGQPWTATTFTLTQLRELGLDPRSVRARETVRLIGENARWEHDGQPFWEGEVEECINGRTVADGAYFGVDVTTIVDRLLGDQLDDGGWNCERERGSVRSSFDSTLNVLEGLLEHERASGGTVASRAARRRGEEFLLERHLFRRLTTGAVADPDHLLLAYPRRWRYDVLRALEYFRGASLHAGLPPDARLAEAVEHVRGRRRADGRWALERYPRGRVWFHLEGGIGDPSRWLTLGALRVLRWWD